MRYAVSFLIGCVLGGVFVFLYLQETGRVQSPGTIQEPAVRQQTTPQTSPPAGILRIAPPKAATPSRSSRSSGAVQASQPVQLAAADRKALPDQLAIPVLGIETKTLRNQYTDRRGGNRVHEAIDIMAPRGTPVLAVADGKIKKLFLSAAGGITIYHADPTETLMYYYAHLDRYSTDLVEGKTVKRGEIIGYVGSTGNAPPGSPHLHFAIMKLPPTKEWWKGQPVNPHPILLEKGVTYELETGRRIARPVAR